MNLLHNWLCQSHRWQKISKGRVEWALDGLPLSGDVLEIGPGFGATTDLIRPGVSRLTCVEIDSGLARRLRHRLAGTNVQVLCESATALSFHDSSFDSVVCFTMLHHVPSEEMQDRLLREVSRVLRPGGVFAGADSLYSWRFHLLHLFDTMVVVSPETFPERLRSAGLAAADVEMRGQAFRFRARKPLAHEVAYQLEPSLPCGISSNKGRSPLDP
jgi:SAM-dependent methyltransferase